MVIWIVITFGIQGSLPSKLFYFFTPSSHFTAAEQSECDCDGMRKETETKRKENKDKILHKWKFQLHSASSYLQKLSSVVSASSVMLSSEWVSSSSSRIIFTTTT